MSMQEIAAKIERKQLLDELELLKKLGSDGQEVVTKEEILRVLKEKEKELLEEICYLEKKEEALIGGELFSYQIQRNVHLLGSFI